LAAGHRPRTHCLPVVYPCPLLLRRYFGSRFLCSRGPPRSGVGYAPA
jgi:hypothetical protein